MNWLSINGLSDYSIIRFISCHSEKRINVFKRNQLVINVRLPIDPIFFDPYFSSIGRLENNWHGEETSEGVHQR